jgi:hypothetical protein
VYYFLSREIKRRVVEELKGIFSEYPGLSKFKVSDKFPYDERPQYGVVVKNVSGNSMPISSDNFIGTVVSHCFTASLKGKKSLIFDWVREDSANITKYEMDDLSSQIDGSKRIFQLNFQPTSGEGNLDLATSPKQILAYVNGNPIPVIDLKEKQVVLNYAPAIGSKLVVEYHRRNLVQAGLYYFEVVEPNKIMIDTLLNFDEIVIKEAKGNEISYQLPHFPIRQKTFEIFENDRTVLREGIHYNVNLDTGLITWLINPDDTNGTTLIKGANYRVFYRYQSNSIGPVDIQKQTLCQALSGVVVAISNWVEVGDKQVVIVTDKREDAAQEYGGHFETSLSMDIYSRDPIQREIIADLLAVKIFGHLKPVFDSQGLMITNVSLNGESEDLYDENTDTVYYMAGIDINFNSDWRFYAPLLPKIKFLDIHIELLESLQKYQVDFIPKTESLR